VQYDNHFLLISCRSPFRANESHPGAKGRFPSNHQDPWSPVPPTRLGSPKEGQTKPQTTTQPSHPSGSSPFVTTVQWLWVFPMNAGLDNAVGSDQFVESGTLTAFNYWAIPPCEYINITPICSVHTRASTLQTWGNDPRVP